MAELPAQLDASVDCYAERCTMHVGLGLVAVDVLVRLGIDAHVISLCYTRSREWKIRYQSLCVVLLRSADNDISSSASYYKPRNEKVEDAAQSHHHAGTRFARTPR
jgi:hypothetical protein